MTQAWNQRAIDYISEVLRSRLPGCSVRARSFGSVAQPGVIAGIAFVISRETDSGQRTITKTISRREGELGESDQLAHIARCWADELDGSPPTATE
jgi:hypothetical protein